MTTAITVDIYCRVAVDGPDASERLDDQEATCRMYYASHGLSVGVVHRDIWSGMQYRDRPGLTALRERYRQHAIQTVVVTYIDRLSRSLTHLAFLLEEMARYQ
jgi:DNA invertase Pin-like site-specific DNA recombinase